MGPAQIDTAAWDYQRCWASLPVKEFLFSILVFGFSGPLVGLLIFCFVSPTLGLLVLYTVLLGLKSPLVLLVPLGFAYALGVCPAIATGVATVVIRRYKLGYRRETMLIFFIGMLLTAFCSIVFAGRGKIGDASLLLLQFSVAGGGASVYCAARLRRHFDQDAA